MKIASSLTGKKSAATTARAADESTIGISSESYGPQAKPKGLTGGAAYGMTPEEIETREAREAANFGPPPEPRALTGGAAYGMTPEEIEAIEALAGRTPTALEAFTKGMSPKHRAPVDIWDFFMSPEQKTAQQTADNYAEINARRQHSEAGREPPGSSTGIGGVDPSEVTDSQSGAKNEQFSKEHKGSPDSAQSKGGARNAQTTGSKTSESEPESMSGCIIVTACTNRNSREVNITREFRNKHLSKKTLAGYYAVAEIIVPSLHNSEKLKGFTKRCLVDRLIDHGEVRLGYKKQHKYISSSIISKAFLALCSLVGSLIKNGDELLEMHR